MDKIAVLIPCYNESQTIAKVVADYMNIVGGKQIASEVINSNRRLNLLMMVQCMTACENLMLLERWKDVCGVLESDISNLWYS